MHVLDLTEKNMGIYKQKTNYILSLCIIRTTSTENRTANTDLPVVTAVSRLL